jgi:hypothetical protein
MKTAIVFIAIALPACSALDPNVGAWRVEQPAEGDAAPGADGDDGECSAVGPDEVCFGRDIRPLLLRTREAANAMKAGRGCVPCHDGNAPTHNGTALSGFDLSTLGELRKGGGSTGPRIIVAYKPDESVLVRALRGQFGSNRMPKGGPFHDDDSEEMRLITTWIAQGAKGNPKE